MHPHAKTVFCHTKPERSSLTPGLILLLLYTVGQLLLSPAMLAGLAGVTGQHQVFLKGDRVILHHPNGLTKPHHGLAKLLVAISHADESGDHVLPCVDTGLYEEPRTSEIVESAATKKFAEGDLFFFTDQCRILIAPYPHKFITSRIPPPATGLTLAQWRTVRMMV